MSTIPLQLVTGFLGSGKTTFVKNYLNEFLRTKKIGIIQNEFSEVNIDGIELRQNNSGFEILEVNNGSVFCVCLLGSFVESLARFIDEIQPNELIMEASGMSDPLSIGQILYSPELRGKVFLDRVWCLVDALNFRKISSLQTQVKHQVRIADTVILNKIDLVENQFGDLNQLIRNINPFAEICPASFAKIKFKNQKQKMKFFPVAESVENTRPDLQSEVVKSNRFISKERLCEFLDLLKKECIRCKGYINLSSQKKVFLQGSFDQINLVDVEYFVAPTEFVVIGNFTSELSFQKLFDKFSAI